MKKILIITGNNDQTASEVIKWIYFFDKTAQIIRLNTDLLFEKYGIQQKSIESPIYFSTDEETFSTDEISVVWFWKWFRKNKFINDKLRLPLNVKYAINDNIKAEENVFMQYFANNLDSFGCTWLNKLSINELNKLEQLQIANKIGLKIPNTFLRTKLEKNDLLVSNITKPMSNCLSVKIKENHFTTFTSRVKADFIKNDFLISLFQQEIEKELEIRIFYLDKKCYSIAIFSQFDTQTSIDFRNYNFSKPNKIECYRLSPEIIEKIKLIMEYFNLQSGSLDFILDKQGNYIFLEINPSGQ